MYSSEFQTNQNANEIDKIFVVIQVIKFFNFVDVYFPLYINILSFYELEIALITDWSGLILRYQGCKLLFLIYLYHVGDTRALYQPL